jgi:hypothetical protein
MYNATNMAEKWYHFLDEPLRPLALESLALLKREKAKPDQYVNYDFVVFPLAKAYEPFLKSYLYRLGLIDNRTYNSKKFSIGRSLNPDIHLEQRDAYWYFDDLAKKCGENVSREVWEMWLVRNRLFHLYPGEIQTTTLAQAEVMINNFIKAIELCMVCER